MDKIAVLDFGGQYAHLIANRIRELNVYSEVLQSETGPGDLLDFCGIILSGGPGNVYGEDAPLFNPEILKLEVPFLGICYGHQLIAHHLGGKVSSGAVKEYGSAKLEIQNKETVFKGLDLSETVWMSHGDTLEQLPEGFETIATTADCPHAAMQSAARRMFGFQFHPEVTHTPKGMKILDNFLTICACGRDWRIENYREELTAEIKEKVGHKNVFLLVSGGVDSTVCLALLNRALGEEKVYGLHIDTGLMRKDESAQVMEALKTAGFSNLHIEDASEDFLVPLKGVVDPEKKRKIIGNTFLDVKEKKTGALDLNPDEWLLAQGTIYPDTIESGGTKNAATIKTHHNRVDKVQILIEKGLVIEPLANLYKNEVRDLGRELNLPDALIERHPFPGPGLGVRILCSQAGESNGSEISILEKIRGSVDITDYTVAVLPIQSVGVQGDVRTYAHPAVVGGAADYDRLEILSTEITNRVREVNRVVLHPEKGPIPELFLRACDINPERIKKIQEADAVAHQLLEENGLMKDVWQMPVVLLPLADENGNEAVVVRAVYSQEAMTARFARLPSEVLRKMKDEIQGVPGIGCVFFDITHKPPATIEWE